jgi:hypothetical protein
VKAVGDSGSGREKGMEWLKVAGGRRGAERRQERRGGWMKLGVKRRVKAGARETSERGVRREERERGGKRRRRREVMGEAKAGCRERVKERREALAEGVRGRTERRDAREGKGGE